MKRLFYGLLGSALFFAATGQARSDAIYWTDLLGDRTPHAVAVGDFNRDGIPDLAVANYSSRNVSVLLGGV